jgi:hypothetical protein
MPTCADSCQHDVSPDAAHPGHELCTISIMDDDGWSYYLVMIEGGSRDTVSVRGFKTHVSPTAAQATATPPAQTIDRLEYHLLNFSTTTSILSGLANARFEGEIQNSLITLRRPGGPAREKVVAFRHASAPFASCDGAGPHGALLFVRDGNVYKGTVSIAGFQEGLGWYQTLVAGLVIAAGIIGVGGPAAYHFADRVDEVAVDIQLDAEHKTFHMTGHAKVEPGTAPASRPNAQQP